MGGRFANIVEVDLCVNPDKNKQYPFRKYNKLFDNGTLNRIGRTHRSTPTISNIFKSRVEQIL